MSWWSERKKEYPMLWNIAVNYLGISATSVPSERAFSIGGLTVTDLRNRLHVETVRELMCLKSWENFFK